VKTNATAALTATGPTGVANSSSTVTATSANATALQAIGGSGQPRITSVFLKRRTGSGNIDLTQDNGTTWVTQSVTSSWARYSLPAVSSATPTVGIRIATSGDAVDVAIFQHETIPQVANGIPSSPLPTGSGTASRTADAYNVTPAAINYSSTAGSWWVETLQLGAGVTTPRLVSYASGAFPLHHANTTNFRLTDSTTLTGGTLSSVFGSVHKVISAFQSGDRAITANGATVVTDAGSTTNLLAPGATISLSNTTTPMNGYLRRVRYLPRRPSNSEMVSMST
jgi:hypothetical protein